MSALPAFVVRVQECDTPLARACFSGDGWREAADRWVGRGGAPRTVAHLEITRVAADGSTSTIFLGFKGREPSGEGVCYHAASPSGRGGRGEVHLEGDRLVTAYEGWTADGSVVGIRDVFEPVEEGRFVSRTYLRPSPEEPWRRIGEDRWTRTGPAR